MEILKMLSASEIFAQFLSFFLLLFLLKRFTWKKILGILDQRKEKIRLEYEAIERKRQEAEAIKNDYEKKLALIQEEADQKLKDARAQAKLIGENARKKAHEEAQDIILEARRQVKHEVSKVQEQLKERIVDIALDAARNLIQEKLTEEGDRKIVEDFIKEVQNTHD